MELVTRIVAGFALSTAIAAAARCTRSLSRSGSVAAVALGTACAAAGWRWAMLLVGYFVAAAAVSHFRAAEKSARTARLSARRGPRNAAQVLANGAIFTLAALASSAGSDGWSWAGVGALAASSADSWGTELGTLSRGQPRSIRSRERVPTGASGGITTLGTAATVAGAAVVALGAGMLGWPRGVVVAALAAGTLGALVDSLLGATAQSRRRCDRCNELTERPVHHCGTSTRHSGGARWLDNDGVNLVATAAGALGGAAAWMATWSG